MGKGSLRQGTLVLSIQLAAPVSGQAVFALISTSLNVLICEISPMPFTFVVTALRVIYTGHVAAAKN